MIEIEEEYKLLEWVKHLQDEYASGAWNKDDDIKFKQILQDHEDAKKCEILESNLRARDGELSSEIRQNVKLKELMEKDRQIVKRLEERIKYLPERIASAKHGVKSHSPIHQELVKEWEHQLHEIQKILEEEK